jgi:hypothetical protein
MFFPNKSIPNEIFPNNGPQSGGAGGGSPLINTQVPEGVTLQGSGGSSPLLGHKIKILLG